MPLISWDSVKKEILSERIGRKVINGEKVALVSHGPRVSPAAACHEFLRFDARQIRHSRLDLDLQADIVQREKNVLRNEGNQIDEVSRTENVLGLIPQFRRQEPVIHKCVGEFEKSALPRHSE